MLPLLFFLEQPALVRCSLQVHIVSMVMTQCWGETCSSRRCRRLRRCAAETLSDLFEPLLLESLMAPSVFSLPPQPWAQSALASAVSPLVWEASQAMSGSSA